MKASHLSALFRNVAIIISLAASQSLLSNSAAAQGHLGTLSARREIGTLHVTLRDQSGTLLTISAVVRLSASEEGPTQISGTNSGQVTFQNLPTGDYSVDVEAIGYAKGHGEIGVSNYGTTEMEIDLREAIGANSLNLPPGSEAILAPKAKKELESGLAALQKKDLNAARKDLEKAEHLAPMHPEVLYLLGTLYAQMNDLARAEDALEKATQMNPHHASAQAALGVLFVNERKFDMAVAPLQKALELNPRSWETRWVLAKCYYNQRQFQLALEQSRQALRDSNRDMPAIALLMGASLAAIGQYEESAAVLRKVILQHSDSPEAARARLWLSRLEEVGKIKPR